MHIYNHAQKSNLDYIVKYSVNYVLVIIFKVCFKLIFKRLIPSFVVKQTISAVKIVTYYYIIASRHRFHLLPCFDLFRLNT